METNLLILLIITAIVDYTLDFSWVAKKLKINIWKNKYKNPIQPYEKRWYYFGLYTPKHKERFPYSSTAFVWTTDPYHFLKAVRVSALILITNMPIYFILIYALLSHGLSVILKIWDDKLNKE